MVCHMTDFRGNEMDLSSKNMYDAFKDEIWKELGPLDPDWFEVLTAQTVNNEDHVSDQDDLCANQEGQFKAPLDKTTVSVNSQLFSTPKVFRHRTAVSPETENEQSFTAEQEKEKMSWTATQSPCLFTMSKEELPGGKYNSIQLQSLDSFDLLQTPQKSPMSYSRQITESLGAQVHPDMTWTSSLNTPPGVPSTLILTKPDESPCAESLSPEKSVVLVRELFPSVSSARVEVRSPVNADKPTSPQESHDSHLNQSDDVWKQKLPDAIEDVDVRSTVASVLKGAETALSLFFTNSNSALRKVKTDSNKRKQIIRTEDPDCSAAETSTTTNNAGPEEQETADQGPGKLPSSPPLKTGDNGLTQWSPLSLSDIPSCTASCYDTSTVKEIKNSSFTEKIQKDSDSGKPLTVTDSGFLKKKRKFIYSVKTPKQPTQEEEPRSERTVSPQRIHDSDLNVKQLEKAPVEADCCSMTEIQNPSAQAEVEDLDMSQLCRDFAQDISEMSDLDQTEDIPQNVFSPSACLSAMKQAKQKAKQTNCEGTGDIKQISTITQNNLISEVTISDSGFQSAVTDITHMTASSFAVPSTENICQSQQQSGLKTDLHRAAPLPNTNKENVHLDHILQADAKLSYAITDSQFLDLGRESESHIKNTSMLQPSRAKGPVDNIDHVPFNGQICVSLPEKTAPSLQPAHAAGFKTASNKGIHISSANLQKARRMFEEAEGEMTLGVKFGRDTTGGNLKSQDSVKTTTTTTTLNSKQPPPPSCEKLADSSFQLTASQRADVSELCTLLEEADSQFELTPFKTSKPKQPCADNTTSPQTADKDLDPDFLAGIDFDDSFSLDAEQPHAGPVRHLNTNSIPAFNVTNKATGLSPLSLVTEEKSSAEDVSASISEGGSGIMSAEVKNADKAPRCKNPLMLGVGFKTAGGGNVRISKECLSKAKALFADLEENRKEGPDAKAQHQQSGDNHLGNALNHKEDNSKFKSLGNNPAGKIQNIKESFCLVEQVSGATDDTTKSLKSTNSWQGGFQMASGKGVCVSAKALQEADAFFKDCDVIDRKESVSEKPRKKTEPLCRSVRRSDFKDKPSPAHTAAPHGNLSVSAKAPPSLSCTTPKNITSSSIDKLAEDSNKLLKQSATHRLNYHTQAAAPDNVGFQTASGKGVAISDDALKKAKSFFSECDEMRDETGGKTETHFKTPIPRPAPRSGGFLSAGGKSAALSAEALQNNNALFNLDKEIPSVSDKRRSNNKEEETVKNKICEKINLGFSTAGGARVHVSKTNLLKAKNLWKEFDSVSEKAMQEVDEFFKDCDITDNYEAFSDKKKLVQLKEDLNVTNISEKSVNGCSEIKNVGTVKNHEKMKPPYDKELHKTFHENTPGPSNRNPPLMTKPVSSPLCAASNDTGASEFGAGGGFFTANGRKVSVSDDAMAKAKSLFSEGAAFESSNNQVHQEKDNMSVQRGGFQTASGKGVSISSAALKKAKTLFGECNEIEDKVGVTPAQIETPDSGQSTRNRPFLSAGGKPVSVSSESLQKAKSLFDDISLNAETPAVSDSSTSDKKQNPGHRGFMTAGGTKVHISHKSLLKAQTLWKEFNDGDLHGVHQSDPAKAKDVTTTSKSDLTTATCKEMPPENSFPLEVKSLNSVKNTAHQNETTQNSSLDKKPADASKLVEADKLHDSPKGETSSVFDRLLNRRSRSEGSGIKLIDESSVLCLQSLHLSGFSETQQKILAQEALDCTRALLEDERVAGQDLSMSTENAPQQDEPRSCEEHKGRGKRPAEDSDVGGQPPLKRRLLEDFDRTGSALQPEISNSNGMMKDRRVFKYSDSLHPNITKPHRNGNPYVESKPQKTAPTQLSSSGGSRSKTQAFVPPFLKNPKTESRKNAMLRENIRTPPAFVPPFKKQRTIIQESSSRPGEGEDKHCSVAGMPANSNTYEPPTENTQSFAQRTANESKDDNQAVASDDITKDNLIKNENLPEDSAAGDTSGSQEMLQDLQNVELARDMQDMRIRKKKRQTIRPLPGSLFLTKTSGESRTPLKAAVDGKAPARFTQKQLYGYGVHQYVCEITGETAESFRFRLQHFIKQEAFIDGGGVQLADGGWLIPSNDGTAGKQEFYRALCDTPGVDPKLISEEWVYNHYRWIVWKQASMERSFPRTVGGLCLTPEQVLLQLKYRYDVEVDHSRRPALRRIMEKDDTAAKTLVLCVCGVVSRGQSPKKQSFSDAKTPQGGDARVENPCAVVWLTDGWYAIKAQLDEPLTAMLHKGRLAVGGKLITHGAQLVGSQDACSPLEAPESLMLKICANSSRPTRWDVKLGFHRDPRPFLLPVSSFYSNGGPVGCVDIVILRSYPLQWMERKPDGGVVFRSVRAEEKEARRFNNDKQKAMEVLFTKIQAEFEKEERGKSKPQRRRRTISRRDVTSLQDGEELYEAVEEDPGYLEAQLSEQQLNTLQSYRRSLMERKQTELQDRYRRALESAETSEGSCPKRDVTPVWRLCFSDSRGHPGSIYLLNLWRPTSDLQSLLKEGCRYKAYNLTTSDGKKLGANPSVQLTGTKKTQFQDLQSSQEWLSTRFQPRVSTPFVDLHNPEFQPLCGEVDLTGLLISVIDGQGSSPAFYLADGKLNFVKIRCFGSLAQSGLEDLVKPRIMLALSNLQLRGQSTHPTPVVYAGELTTFSTNPKEVHLRESLSQLRNLMQSQENFFVSAEEKLRLVLRSDGPHFISSPALQTGTSAPSTERRQSTKMNLISQHQARNLGSFTPVSRNPPSETESSTEKNPSTLKRKRALDYLSRIPSPPPLTLLNSVNSPCVKKTFNPPRRSGTPSTLKPVQTPARKPVDQPVEREWVNDEELAMIDTQDLL
ncbi:breast cancer type 2 susceptibility protein [Xyrichtys novacula]|uniref:Breast cancer type 2 susceptibility protein n=1 Tax=Xyrichtys novacula TaxID=13765 RepID=A0AAV1FVN8_XYRNO|nr:breast cancer type 2 susceptibility protein [Xyrichtys novacula]